MNNLFLGKDPHLINHVGYDYNCVVQAVHSYKVLFTIPVSSYDHGRIKRKAQRCS